MNHEYFMTKALNQAEKALSKNEFPVGCVLVHEDKVITSGARKGTSNGFASETDHAEMAALKNLEALNFDKDKKEITIYCTMEPCLMCYAAILLTGLGRIVYAYEDVMGGGTKCDLSSLTPLYKERRIPVIANILRKESLDMFKAFFQNPENNYWRGSLLARYTLEQ